jgi:hypothetical protein
MMEEDFYATIKLKTGEEIYCKASSIEDEDNFLLISNPVCINEVRLKNNVTGYKIEPWLKTTTDDLFVINVDNIITMTESEDFEMIMIYESYISQINIKKKNKIKLDRKMGYISSVEEAKKILENIYNNN